MAFPPSRSVPDWLAYPAVVLGIIASSLAIGRYLYANRIRIGQALRRMAPKNIIGLWVYGVSGYIMSFGFLSNPEFNIYAAGGIIVITAAFTFIDLTNPDMLMIRRFIPTRQHKPR